MRVLSFIPAFLLAAASFVAAAPASVPDTTCVSNPTGGNGNDAPVQPVIAIITSATNNMQPLSDKLCTFSFDVVFSVAHEFCSWLARRLLHAR